ncbi:MAG TPA: class I SAM-dependent rRNA methyltransferase [Planctomycetaceae bacterium]|nr:class I SAM-dependent rRNA methyltransferase [Planctomycetaceae bacterium]
MPTKKRRNQHSSGQQPSRGDATSAVLLQQRSLELPSHARLPIIRLRSVRRHPHLFRKLIGQIDPNARPGDLVAVQSPQGELLGHGLFNPRAEITVRMLNFNHDPPGAEFWDQTLRRAVRLRRDLLRLDEKTDACRVIHAEADGMPGLVIDRYSDVLSAEVFSLAMFQRSEALLSRLSELLGTTHTLVQVPVQTHGQEGFLAEPVRSPNLPEEVAVAEFGTKFSVRFDKGHKTGFFCDQRDNRRRLAAFCTGRTVLDLCCYTGGFAIQAKRLGNAADVTAVDLDEPSIDLARANARLNQQKVHFVHADAFGYMRDMIANGRTFDVVVLDPPKLIRNRRELEEGTKAHLDLNRLAMQLVADGGLLLSCSCSGLLDWAEFLRLLTAAARQAGQPGGSDGQTRRAPARTLQILDKTGASPDHPVAADCPETEYLKCVWMRVLPALS